MLNIFKKKLSAEKLKPTEHKNAAALAKSAGRRLEGVVVSDKMKKTAVVAITTLKLQPKYRKYFKVTKRFKAHDENNEYRVGDKVVIQETRPISKEKRWMIIEKLENRK